MQLSKMVAFMLVKSLLFVVSVFSANAFSAADISYTHAAPLSDDPGNEITQEDVSANYTQAIPGISSKTNIYSAGVSVKYTHLDFDEPQLSSLELLKLEAPLQGTHILNKKMVTWTLSPGIHGQANHIDESDFRIQGQTSVIFLRENLKWILGVGFGDTFGEVKAFPVLGAIWQINENSVLTLMFPQVKYEYTTESKTTYSFKIEPSGSQWQWQKGQILNSTVDLDVTVSGIKSTVGVSRKVKEKLIVYSEAGVIANRKFEIFRHDNPSISGEQELENTWVAQLGLKF